MTDYALNDRGSLDVVTEDYYDTEITRVFGGLTFGVEQSWSGTAALIPEPDNPFDPRTVSVRVGPNKVGHLDPEDAEKYWHALGRVIASGYTPTAPLSLTATVRTVEGRSELETRARLSLSSPELLFPVNTPPERAALVPQGSSIKVLDEQEFAENLQDIVPNPGVGRVFLSLVDTDPGAEEPGEVAVYHEQKQVGRLSSHLSEQFLPLLAYTRKNDRVATVWGTVRSTVFEASITLQAARPQEIDEDWYLDLPDDQLDLVPDQEEFEVPSAYIAAEGDRTRHQRRRRRSNDSSRAASTEVASTDGPRRAVSSLVLGMLALTLVLVAVGVWVLGQVPLAGAVCLILGAATAGMTLYLLFSAVPRTAEITAQE